MRLPNRSTNTPAAGHANKLTSQDSATIIARKCPEPVAPSASQARATEAATANLRHIAHHARLFEVSSKTGAGLEDWCDFLTQQHEAAKKRDVL